MTNNSTEATPVGCRKHLRLAVFWAIAGGFAGIAVLPYLFALLTVNQPVPWAVVCVVAFAQTALMMFLASWVGLRLGESVHLDSPLARAWIDRRRFPPAAPWTLSIAAAVGLIVGFVILGLDTFVFWPALPQTLVPMDFHMPRWKGFLASFYGGIIEEVFCRLLVMTFFVWAMWKLCWRKATKPPAAAFWTAILAAAILFALGHLPATARMWPLTPAVLTRNLTLNALPGFFCGVFYWKWGLEHAMLAHFCTDIALHVVGGY
jgi:membrane protease YdiL (CAAX protease family)